MYFNYLYFNYFTTLSKTDVLRGPPGLCRRFEPSQKHMFCGGRQVFQVGQAPSGPTIIRPLLMTSHRGLFLDGQPRPPFQGGVTLADPNFAGSVLLYLRRLGLHGPT